MYTSRQHSPPPQTCPMGGLSLWTEFTCMSIDKNDSALLFLTYNLQSCKIAPTDTASDYPEKCAMQQMHAFPLRYVFSLPSPHHGNAHEETYSGCHVESAVLCLLLAVQPLAEVSEGGQYSSEQV